MYYRAKVVVPLTPDFFLKNIKTDQRYSSAKNFFKKLLTVSFFN